MVPESDNIDIWIRRQPYLSGIGRVYAVRDIALISLSTSTPQSVACSVVDNFNECYSLWRSDCGLDAHIINDLKGKIDLIDNHFNC